MAKHQTKGLLSALLVCLESYFALAVYPAQPSRPDCYIPCDEINCGFSITCTWDPNQVFQIPTNYTLHWEPTNSRVGNVTSRTNSSGVIPREHFSSHSELRVWVRAINRNGFAKSPYAEFNTKNIKKPLPPKVTVSQQDPSEVYWNSPCDQLHFSLGSCDVRHRTEGGVWEEHNGFQNMYTFDSLQPCTTYELQIRCVCDIALMSDWSESHRVQGTETAPVGELDVWRDCGTFPPSTHCVLTWKRLPASQACGLILGYEVQLSYNNGIVAFMNLSTAEARCDEVQCKFSCSLKDASSVSVAAYNAHGTTVPSYLALPFLGQEENKQVLQLQMNEEYLTVSWNTTVYLTDNLKGYVLEYKQTGRPQGQGLDWIKVSNRTTAIIKGHFKNYTSYEVSLFAVTDRNKAHHLSSVTAYSLQRTPSKVPAFTVLSIAVTQATLQWEPVPKQDGVVVFYQIEVDTGHSGSPQVHNVSASRLQRNMTFTLQHLNPGERYKVWIRAVSEAGPGEKATISFKTKDPEDFAHWSLLLGILFAIVVVFILYCVCRGANKDRPLVKPFFYEKVPDPRNSHIFRQMKHQINDHIAWISSPTYEPHPKISILEVVDTTLLGSKPSLEKTSEADRFMRPVVRKGSSQVDLQADQREDAVTEDCQRKDNKCGREAYSKMIDSDEEGGREEEEEDREECWSSSEEEQCTIGYEKHFMPTASDILEV